MSQWIRETFVPAEVGQPVAEREVDGAVDLLVEERVPHVARDPGVAADPELAEAARALVAVERLEQVRPRSCPRRRRRRLPPSNRSRIPVSSAPEVHGRELGEGDRPLRGVLDRAAEELAARDVRAAGVDLHRRAPRARAADPCRRRRSAPRRRRRTGRRSAASAPARRPSREGRRRRGSRRTRRSPCPRPARAPASGTGSPTHGSSWRKTRSIAGRNAACMAPRRSAGSARGVARVLRRLDRRSARRSAPSVCCSIDGTSAIRSSESGAEPRARRERCRRTRGAGARTRRARRASRAISSRSGRPGGVPTTSTCQPGWTPTQVSTSSSASWRSRGSGMRGTI